MSNRSVVAAVARSQVRRRWRSLVLVGVVAGLVGGVATACVTGARRSSTAYDRLLAATDFPDAFVQLIEPAPGLPERVAASPAVERSVVSIFAVGRDAAQRNQVLLPVQAAAEPISDPVLVRGRTPDPTAAGEVTVSESLADSLGFSVGDTFAYEGLTRDEFADLLRDRWDGSASGLRIDLRVVGISRSPTDAVLGDFPTLIGTPALVERFGASVPDASAVWVHLRPGATADDLREDLAASLPQEGARGQTAPTLEITDLTAERTMLDDSVVVLVWGLLAFGAVALVAGAVVAGQLAARVSEQARSERRVLQELGVDRRGGVIATTASAGLAVAVAALVTVVVAVVSSRWTPIGVAGEVEPSPGVEWHVGVLAAGALVTATLVAAIFALGALRGPRPVAAGTRRVGRVAGLASEALSAGPVGSVAAVSAFGAGRRIATSRIAFTGVVAGVSGLVAAALFGASLGHLTGEPLEWGAIGDHFVEVPEPVRERTRERLRNAPEVDAYAELGGMSVVIDGRPADGYRFEALGGDIAPVLLRGSLPVTDREVALGPSLLEGSGLEPGDRVDLDGRPARVVGSVLTFALAGRSSVTEGVLVGGRGGTPDFTTLVVRYHDDVDAEAAAQRLYGDLEYFAPSRPADVTNLAALRPLPPLLVALLAVIGAGALAHAAFGIGARGRRELSILRALGFSPGHAIRVVVAATVLVVGAATAIGIPIGVVLARSAWTRVAATTDLAAEVRVPTVLLAGLPGLAVVTLVAGLSSGHRAARRPVSEVLRTE